MNAAALLCGRAGSDGAVGGEHGGDRVEFWEAHRLECMQRGSGFSALLFALGVVVGDWDEPTINVALEAAPEKQVAHEHDKNVAFGLATLPTLSVQA